MKTLEQAKTYKSDAIDGRDVIRLSAFLPESEFHLLGLKVNEEYKGKHKPLRFTRRNVLSQLKKDVAFGFEKALNRRGISSSCMHSVVKMWNWILEEGLEDFDGYAQYGLPLFKATALKYGWDNPIGADFGSERKYSSEGE